MDKEQSRRDFLGAVLFSGIAMGAGVDGDAVAGDSFKKQASGTLTITLDENGELRGTRYSSGKDVVINQND